MKVTFPHMGYLWIPVSALLRKLGLDVVVPPPITRRTLSLGVQHAPEFACFPLKLNLGNFMEAYERGADTIIMAGGVGPCRFGYYAQVQQEILWDLGYKMKMVVLEPPKGHWWGLWKRIRWLIGERSVRDLWRALGFAWHKFVALDAIERAACWARPRAAAPRDVRRAVETAVRWVHEAETADQVREAREEGVSLVRSHAVRSLRDPLKVGIVGEIYTLLEPFANYRLEEKLGALGVEVDRSLYLSDWIRAHVVLDALRVSGEHEVKQAAQPYAPHFVGGHGQDTVGRTVLYARHGFDGVIQVMPFTCMPEIVAQSILPRVAHDYGIAVLTLIVDEHSADAGIQTRLEAFVDLLRRRRSKKKHDAVARAQAGK